MFDASLAVPDAGSSSAFAGLACSAAFRFFQFDALQALPDAIAY
jgi:hypothetical protein